MSGQVLRIGTRKSAMALAQTDEVARLLRASAGDLAVEIVKFETRGDQDQTSRLLRHGGKGGAFVAEIREAMRAGTLQAAMHSLKDVPGNEETPGLVLAATLARDAANDSLVLRPGLSLDAFRASRGKGFMIGTNAVRRAAYLRRLFPEATVIHFRGAADTRIAKLDRGAKQRLPDGGEVGPADALVMARSGLERIGMTARIAHDFSVDADRSRNPNRLAERLGDSLGNARFSISGRAEQKHAAARVDGGAEPEQHSLVDEEVFERAVQVFFGRVLIG